MLPNRKKHVEYVTIYADISDETLEKLEKVCEKTGKRRRGLIGSAIRAWINDEVVV